MSDKIDNEYLAVCPTSGLDRLPFSIRSWHEFYKSCSKENLSIIVALEDKTSGIGFQNDIPWKIVEDQTFFRRMTLWRSQSSLVAAPMSKNAVIMGWKTWLSMKCKPLPDRVNMIVCSAERIQKEKLEATKDQQLLYASDFEIGLKQLWENPKVDRVFAIGGTRIYEAALDCPHLSDIYISRVKFPGTMMPTLQFDTLFPESKCIQNSLCNSEWILNDKSQPIDCVDEKHSVQATLVISHYSRSSQ